MTNLEIFLLVMIFLLIVSDGWVEFKNKKVIKHCEIGIEKLQNIIKEKNETKGIKAEYEWLRKNYPGYEAKKQALIVQKKTPYDVITIVTENGEEKSIYFDISNFYGKY
jgi:hypothetical protein